MPDQNYSAAALRKENRNRIFQYIYHAPTPVSKQEIAQHLSFSLPTIHKTIAELLEQGVIVPGELQESTGGRRPVGYMPNPDTRYAIGISLSSDRLRFLASDLTLKELAYKKISLESFRAEDIGEQIEKERLIFMQEHNLSPEKLLGVGITIPGVLDWEETKVVLSPTLNLRNLSLDTIRKKITCPVYFENESTSAGFAEWLWDGDEGSRENFVFLSLENGVGGAVLIGNGPYPGQNRRSAEFGHMCVEPGGLKCSCGKRGCLEAYTSMSRIRRESGKTAEDFFAALEKGAAFPGDTALFEDYLNHLAIGIHNLRMAFDCDVVLGGSMSAFLKPYLPDLQARTAALNMFEDDCSFLRLAHFPNHAGMRGVAWHFIHAYIGDI